MRLLTSSSLIIWTISHGFVSLSVGCGWLSRHISAYYHGYMASQSRGPNLESERVIDEGAYMLFADGSKDGRRTRRAVGIEFHIKEFFNNSVNSGARILMTRHFKLTDPGLLDLQNRDLSNRPE